MNHPGQTETIADSSHDPYFVSGRFLSDFFGALERQGILPSDLLGDLPIRMGENGQVRGPVDWDHFSEFMRRLEHSVGGQAGLEACGEIIGAHAPTGSPMGLAGFTTSPQALYRAVSQSALLRGIPGIEAQLTRIDDGHLEIHAGLVDGVRACPQLFHVATGGARVLPRLIGLSDAVVYATVDERQAHYRIAVPPSLNFFARLKRVYRTIISAGSTLHTLEAQQLELQAKNESLQRAHDALSESERRYRAIADTAVDVLCEIDGAGRVLYVSTAITDLIGYSPEQVTGSHFRLWIPSELHDHVNKTFASLATSADGHTTQDRLRLHTKDGLEVVSELTARSYDSLNGERRIVCILRSASNQQEAPAASISNKRARRRPHRDRGQLRGHLDETRLSHPPHPVERSLERLLAALDESVSRTGDFSDDRLIEATTRMTQIVESAMVQASELAPRFQWIETRKLIRGIRDAFLTKEILSTRRRKTTEENEFDLRIDIADAPTEILTEEPLLCLALTSLLDWAAYESRRMDPDAPVHRIDLRVREDEAADGPTPNRSIVFSVTPSCHSSCDPGVPPATQAAISQSTGELALAVATDAAEALGGRLGDDPSSTEASAKTRKERADLIGHGRWIVLPHAR